MPDVVTKVIRSGLASLDELLQGLRLGDNVVWQVDHLGDYQYFAQPFAEQVINDGLDCVYLHFGPNPAIIKQQRSQDEERLTRLLQVKANLSHLMTAKANLSELSKALIARLENCTPDDKRLALEMLDIQVYATVDKIEINGVVPVALSTTEQTWA